MSHHFCVRNVKISFRASTRKYLSAVPHSSATVTATQEFLHESELGSGEGRRAHTVSHHHVHTRKCPSTLCCAHVPCLRCNYQHSLQASEREREREIMAAWLRTCLSALVVAAHVTAANPACVPQCTRLSTQGYHRGKPIKVLGAQDAPDQTAWEPSACASTCANTPSCV